MAENTSGQSASFVDKRTDGPGVSRIDPSDPAAPLYRLLAKMRSPVSLRDLMILPVRTGYIGQQQAIDPSELPKSARQPGNKSQLAISRACGGSGSPR